jgi:hypothetical protein
MTPATLFSAGSTLALVCWLALALTLFLPRHRERVWQATGLAVPGLLAVAYAGLIARGFAEAPDGGFGSIEAVRALFASDAALAAGWLHYLAFDLFAGTYIAREGLASRVPAPLLVPCLALTFLFGPAGLLLFLALRHVNGRSRVIGELLRRQRTLTLYGIALLALTVPALLAQCVDPRTLAGVNVWVKPAKFLFSVGVYALTLAWFFGYVRDERRGALPLRALVAVLVLAGTLELVYIAWQAAHGLDSHYNLSSPFHIAMYALMGIFAALLVGTGLPLAWEIARRPAAGLRADFAAAVVIGLLLTVVLGGILGAYMSSRTGHAVGATGGHVPLFGWNRSGGDLRVAHFFGIHAQQAIPLLSWALAAANLGVRARWTVMLGGAAVYGALTLAVFAQAVAGRAVLPG